MATTEIIDIRDTAIVNLHPIMRARIERLNAATSAFRFRIGMKECRFEMFEGYRSPERQKHLLTRTKSTKAGPWQSAHQYGLAVDYAVRVMKDSGPGEWLWPDDAPWRHLKRLAMVEGLDIPIAWDKGHVSHPMWQEIRRVL